MCLIDLGFCSFQPWINSDISYLVQLLSLDAAEAAGVSAKDFATLLSQCNDCRLVVARGAMEAHRCPTTVEQVSFACSYDPATMIARLESTNGSGIALDALQQIVVRCNICFGFVMRRKVRAHICI
jgi:hypothetical protein